jgi:hypothetical protein
MATTTHPGLPGPLPSLSLPLRRRRLVLSKRPQEASPEPSWRTAAPILLFLLGLALMRLGPAEVGTHAAPTVSEMTGD